MNQGSNTRKKKGKEYRRKIEAKREIENQKKYPKLFGKDSYKRKINEMIVANTLEKKLRSIQTLSKKIGAKPSSNPYQIPTVMLKF